MSRHRFLMLGASIVGVGMLPFAQRKYAYAQENRVFTPWDYVEGATKEEKTAKLDVDDHTAILRDMFTDPNAYNFHLDHCPNDVGWMVVMGKGFTSFPVKSNWTLTGTKLADGTLDSAAGLHRKGELVNGQLMFRNADALNGNSDIWFQNVYVDGHKFDLANQYYGGYLDIDKINTFLRIGQDPQKQTKRWNYRLHFLGCTVKNWPGISCEFRQLNNFEVSGNKIQSSHRGSLIFRIGARFGKVYDNTVENGGDDCIAFNGNTGFYSDWPNTGGAANVELLRNILGEKKGQDIPEPAGARRRDGNSPLAIRHATGPVYVNSTTVTQTEDGYIDVDGVEHPPQPAVEVRDRQGFTSRKVYIKDLSVQNGPEDELPNKDSPALWIPSPGVTGGIDTGVCNGYAGPESLCPWQIAPPANKFYRTNLTTNGSPDEACEPPKLLT